MFFYQKKISAENLDRELELASLEIQKLNLPTSFFQCLTYIISELISNIKEHSSATNVKVKIGIKNKSFDMVVMDNGIGLRQSYLNKQIISKDDQSAIELALSGLSTKDFKERGFGLYSVRRLVLALDGIMNIRSGKASAEIKENSISFKSLAKNIKGVEIKLQGKIKPIKFYKYIE